MESPLNKKIQRGENRKAASPKKAAVYSSLREKVLALVQESNANVREERRVTPRAALTVMDRALASLSSLSVESREAGALREVAIFISTATKTFNANNTKHRDLLAQGHPLSALNASLTPAEYREKYAAWLSADSAVNDDVRSLVASAHAAEPGSIEREHAFSRLLVTKKFVPGYFKIDIVEAITAAFGSGNSSAARRARVALQWRDRKGRWVEMGRGVNFNFRMPDGSVARVSGNYVGVRPPQKWDADGDPRPKGLIQVSGDKNLPDGIYAIRAGNAQTYSARLTTGQLKRAGITQTRGADQNIVNIPTKDELVRQRVDAPTGWTKVDDNTFTSDDNYTVKVTDGEYTLFRQNADGSLAGKVGEGANWAEINGLATGDEESYDVVKGQDSAGGRQTVKARLDARTAHNAEFDRLEKLVDDGIDQNGNKVPAGWKGVVRPGRMPDVERRAIGADRVFGEEGLPYIEYEKAIADDYASPVVVTAGYDLAGTLTANGKDYPSWNAVEADIPNWIKEEERKRGRKLEPIANIPSMSSERKPGKATENETRDENGIKVPADSETVAMEQNGDAIVVRMPDGSLVQYDTEGPEGIPYTEKQKQKFISDIKNDETIWFDEEGRRNWKALLDKEPQEMVSERKPGKATEGESLGKEIYERRIATGDSLDKVAEDLGLTRIEVRRLESEYARTLEGKEEEIKITDIKLPGFEDGPSDYARFGPEPDDADYRAGYFDKDGNRLPGAPASNDPRPALTKKQEKKLDAEIRDLIENPPAPTELDKRIEKFLKETREEWDNARKDYARIQGEVGDSIMDPPMDFGPDKDDKSVEEIIMDPPKSGPKELSGNVTQQIITLQETKNTDTRITGTLDNGIKYDIYRKDAAITWRGEREVLPDVFHLELSGRTFDSRQAIKDAGLKWDPDAKVWRKAYYNLGSFETTSPWSIQSVLEKLNGGDRLPGKEAVLPTAEVMRQQMIDNPRWTPEILARRNGVSVEEINAILDNEPQQMTSERKPGKATEGEGGAGGSDEPPSGPENSISKEAFNSLKNKIAEESKGGYFKSGLLFYHELVGASDGARSKDVTFMIDDDEEMDPLGTISPDGTITWNDPSKQEDWAPALKSALRPFVGDDNKSSSFSYDTAKATALDSKKNPQERYAAIFDGAAGENLSEYLNKQNIDASELNPSVPKNAEVVFTDGDGQNLTVRYPDGTYHYLDTGATTPDGFISVDNVNNFDSSVHDKFLGGLFEGDGLPYYRGAFIDDNRQKDITSRAFSYDKAKKTASDPSKPAQERYAAIFDGAKGRDFFKYTADSGVERSELDPSIPEGTEVVFADGDGQNLTLRYPDGTYHYLDTGATSDNGLITADPVSAYDAEGVNDKVLKDLLDINSLMYARGGFIDDARQGEIARSSSGGSGPDEPPTPPTGGNTPGSGFTDYVIDLAEDNSDLGKDLEEKLDDDAEEAGFDLMNQIYEDASDRYELSQDIADNKPEGMSDNEFVDDAVARMRKQLSDVVDSAIEERRSLEDDEELEVDFDKEAFVNAGAKRFEELLREELDNMGDGGEGLGFAETETILDSLYEQDLLSLDDRNSMMQKFSDIMQDEERQIGFDDIESAVDDLYENDKITLEQRNNIMVKATDLIQDQMPDEDEMTSERKPGKATEGEDDDGGDEPPTPPTGGGDNTPGGGFTDYVIDLAEDNSDLGKDLEERLEDDAADVGAELMDQIYDDASRRYELADDIADNKPEGMSNDEFVRDAVAKMRKQLSDIVDSAIDERRSLGDDEADDIDFDKDAFIDAGAKRFEELLREELDNMGEDEDGPGEPPTPPTGGTPPKTPTPSQPSTPGLFNNFDVPNGAFQLRTVDYEPEGRVDEASTNFTDDPKKLATRFTPQDLVAALSEALVGTSDDAAIAEILNANVDDAGDIPGAEDMDSVDIPRANMGQPSGAGRLEFNAGEEYVPMEALYNAVWEAGLDPNRVVANIYDSVNGNNNNLNRLIEAQGGVPSPEEAQLVDDITAEIRQIKSSSPDSVSSVNKKDKPLPEEDPLPGQLIENVPIDFENPDYYIPDSNAYIPSQPEVDENGFTDNPEILSRDYETADLIDQMITGITDGSGAALLSFDDITVEVPVEALRDAIQLQNINTNVILAQLKKESNDMSDGMPEQISNQKIKDKNDGEFELNLIKIDDMYEGALINKDNGRVQIVARDRDERVVKKALKDAGAHIKQAANGDEAMDDGVIPNLDSVEQPTLQAHSQMIRDLIEQTGGTVDDETADKIRDVINEKGLLDWSEADDAEIIEAITEVAGPDILRQQAQQPEPRRFPPTTGDRQAPEAPVNPPAPSGPFDSEGFNNISNLIRTTFPRGFTDDNKLVAVWESNSGNESMMLISRGEGTEPILFRWQERAGLFSFTPQNTEDWFTGEGARVLGWRAPTDEQQATLRSFVSNDNLVPDSADTPRDPSADAPEPEAPETPALVYPGPENRGYHPDNTVLDRAGKVMGKGTRIRASRDGRTGTVIAVQNIDNRTGDRIPYVRVRFDDGTVAVRSALKVRAIGDAVQVVPDREPPATPPIPTDIGERLDAPVRNPGVVAGDGSITGVSNLGELPQELEGLGNPDARQKDFGAWGDRADEIAFAGRNRVSLDNIRKLNVEWNLATLAATTLDGDERRSKRAEADEIKARLDKAIFDTFGVRDGVTFGNNGYTLDNRGISVSLTGRDEESITRDHVPMAFTVAMGIKDKDGRVLGTVNRTLSYVSRGDGTPGYWKVKNDYLNINNAGDKKSGFATAYNRYMEDWYIANGVKEIHVRAAGGGSFQGAFVWALNGFNWETPGDAESELMSRLQRMRRSANTDKERATIDRLLQKTNQARITGGGVDLDKAPTPMELALVGWYPGATNWLGKKFMTENSWSGIKRLDPVAKEQIQAINYDQIRRARSRIKDKVNRPGVSREFVLKANSDQFLAENQMLTPYIEEIRFAFQNNSSLATLSPAAKTVLSRWVGEQIMTGDSRSLPLEDAFKLRTALDGEAAADNPRNGITDFGVGDFLTSANFEDISRNRLAGFDVRRLGTQESGYNDTYLVKHIDSGQLFYVKKDELAKQYRIDPVRAEVEAGMLTRALGFQGMYETRANTKDTSGEVLVMQQAGSSIPLASSPYMLSDVFENGGIQGSDGAVFVTPDNLLDSLATPEDAIRIALLDLLINNQDRHNGNVLLAVDGTDPSRLRMLPVDHSLAQMESNLTNFNFEGVLTADDENVYTSTLPVLLERMGQDALIQAFRNEANKLNAALRSNTFSPSGNELRMIIDRYGSLNAYRDAIEKRTAALLTPGTRAFEGFKEVLTPGYWR